MLRILFGVARAPMPSQRPAATAEPTFWERLAARTRLAGAAATIENSRTIMRIATGAAWAAAANAVFTAFAFFWFDEAAAGIMTVAVTASFLGAWVWYAMTGSVLGLAVITVWRAPSTSWLSICFLGGTPTRAATWCGA